MMKKKTFMTLSLMGVLLTGCTSMQGTKELANLTNYEVDKFIVDGKTDKHDVVAKFGTQYAVEEDFEGREKWVYQLTTYKPKASNWIPIYGDINRGTNNKDITLTIFFDENGKVIRHRFHEKDYESTRWHQYHPSTR